MLKSVFHIILTPVFLIIRLLLGVAAFVVSVSSSLLGLLISVFALLACVEFFIGYWQNGIALLVLCWAVSPVGLPGIAEWFLEKMASACSFIEGKLC